MGTDTNGGGNVKRGHKWWERESDGNEGSKRSTYTGSSSRTDTKQKAGRDKDARQTKSERRELREPSEGPSA